MEGVVVHDHGLHFMEADTAVVVEVKFVEGLFNSGHHHGLDRLDFVGRHLLKANFLIMGCDLLAFIFESLIRQLRATTPKIRPLLP